MKTTSIRTKFVYTNGSESMHNPTLRVLQILNLLCQNIQPMRLSDISRELNMPKSTLLPILQTMVQQQYIRKDEADRYCPGYALLDLGAAARTVFSESDHIRENLKSLVEKFNETCYFGVPEEGNVRYVEKIDSPQPLRMLTTIGHRLPAYATGIGKALLLDKTKEELKNMYPDAPEKLTKNTITDMDILYSQLQNAKQLGYTWEEEESTEHIRCFAVPVRKQGRIVGAVSIAIPVFRFCKEQENSIIKALKETARKIEKGYQLL